MIFSTLLTRAILSDPYIPTEPTRIFALVNHAKDCLAMLESSFGATLKESDKTQIIERISPLAQQLNLTFYYNNSPFDNTVVCYFIGKHSSEVEVGFCGEQSDLWVAGTLNFQYLHHLFNSTEIKEILEQATTHNCGKDPMGNTLLNLGYMLAGLFALSLLCGVAQCLYRSCQKSVSVVAARQTLAFKTNYASMGTTTERAEPVNASPAEPPHEEAQKSLMSP